MRKGSADAIAMDLGEVARAASPGPAGLSAEGWFETEHMSYPTACTSRW